ncbi:hypothetical protein [Rugosimonospora acidiphila]|uniref:hypothetical protein n=1 Tax=Rugosimonospora acidiphila TaxID=556531 RepID=UPI0031ED5EB1
MTAALSHRGSNASRITLASLMGFYVLIGLCGGAFALVNVGAAGFPSPGLRASVAVVEVLAALLAVTIGVLLLLPAANRFFYAGPGRRFVPST